MAAPRSSPPVPGAPPLNAKQLRFARLWATPGTPAHHNGTEAAKGAGYAEANAGTQGSALLNHPGVWAEVQRLEAEWLERSKLTAAEVVAEIDLVSSSDLGDLFDLDAEALLLRPMKDWPERARRAVSDVEVKVRPDQDPALSPADSERLREIADHLAGLDGADPTAAAFLETLAARLAAVRFDRYRVVKIKMHPKVKGLDMAGRHRKLFVDRQEFVDPNGQTVAPLLVMPYNGRDPVPGAPPPAGHDPLESPTPPAP